jgi:hypothetical protein
MPSIYRIEKLTTFEQRGKTIFEEPLMHLCFDDLFTKKSYCESMKIDEKAEK